MSSLFQLELSGLTESANSTIKSKFVISRKKELNVDFIVKNRLSLTKKGVVRRALDDTDGLQASNFETYQIVQPNDLIFRLIDLEKNTGRRVALAKEKGIMSPAYIRMSVKINDINPEFVEFWFQHLTLRGILSALGEGVRKNLNAEQLGEIRLPITSLQAQNSISSFLNKKIGLADEFSKNIDKYTSKVKSSCEILIQRMVFGRNCKNGISVNVGYVQQIPSDWEVVSNSRLFAEIDERNMPNLSPLNVSLRTGVHPKTGNEVRTSQDPKDFANQKVARENDIVFNKMRMWQGAVGVAPCDGLVSTDYTVARPVDGIHPEYFMHLFKTEQYRTEINRWSRGIVPDRNRLYWDEFKAIKSLVPPYDEQVRIVDEIRDMKAKTDALGRNIEAMRKLLKEYRSAIITAAVTGQIEIPEVIT